MSQTAHGRALAERRCIAGSRRVSMMSMAAPQTASLAIAGEATGYNVLKNCRHGSLLYNRNDQYIGRSLDLYGEYCEARVETVRQLLKPGDVVVDVGAYIGHNTVFLARAVGE